MQYKVISHIGDEVSDSIMTQKELDECRSRCEVIEAVAASGQLTATDSPSQIHENDGWTEFSYGGKRWSFDSDQLAQWDKKLEGFEFLAYHQLAQPCIKSVIGYIKRQDY